MADKKLPDPEHELNPDVYRVPEAEATASDASPDIEAKPTPKDKPDAGK